MATRTIVGKVYNLLEQPVANAKLTFTLNQSAYTLDRSYETSSTEIKSDALGNWAVALWVNSGSSNKAILVGRGWNIVIN